MDRLLIVEGEDDQKFFASLFRAIGMVDMVEQIKFNPRGKANALKTFVATLQGLTRASNKRVGLVVDADEPSGNAGDGFASSLAAINERLRSCSFNALTQAPQTTGFITRANDKPQVQVGAWVMPDNRSDGYLEHFAGRVVSSDEVARFQFAADRAKDVAERKHSGPDFTFKPHHLPKAAVGTWLAWSDPPRMSLGTAVSRGWLDIQHPQFQNLVTWLKTLYS